MLKVINISQWASFSYNHKIYYTPNADVIRSWLEKNNHEKFCLSIKTEFACIIIDNLN